MLNQFIDCGQLRAQLGCVIHIPGFNILFGQRHPGGINLDSQRGLGCDGGIGASGIRHSAAGNGNIQFPGVSRCQRAVHLHIINVIFYNISLAR